ncbi:MAG: hypothetical protein ACREBC_38960, partial [Pyrinomonadaceae bacterium]
TQASQVLRLLRVALRANPAIPSHQLRFRLGTAHTFDGHSAGFALRSDAAWDLGLGEKLVEYAQSQPVATGLLNPTTDIEKKADLATRWMERACFTGESLIALLYLFFALESLLGDKSEKLKAHDLAFRQGMLSHVATGGFTHPNTTWFLYDQVRSAAVHGEDVPEVGWDVVKRFTRVVSEALDQYITLASTEGITKRGKLLTFLKAHPDRPEFIEWLHEHGGSAWTKYLQKITGGSEEECNPSH